MRRCSFNSVCWPHNRRRAHTHIDRSMQASNCTAFSNVILCHCHFSIIETASVLAHTVFISHINKRDEILFILFRSSRNFSRYSHFHRFQSVEVAHSAVTYLHSRENGSQKFYNFFFFISRNFSLFFFFFGSLFRRIRLFACDDTHITDAFNSFRWNLCAINNSEHFILCPLLVSIQWIQYDVSGPFASIQQFISLLFGVDVARERAPGC